MEQNRDSVQRSWKSKVAICSSRSFGQPIEKNPMSTTEQWRRALRWAAGITACFFVIYASAVAVRLLLNAPQWAEALSKLPPEMLSNFLQTLVLGPFLFSIPVFVISLAVVRVVCSFMGRWNLSIADAGVKP